jgi:hypothetical protein
MVGLRSIGGLDDPATTLIWTIPSLQTTPTTIPAIASLEREHPGNSEIVVAEPTVVVIDVTATSTVPDKAKAFCGIDNLAKLDDEVLESLTLKYLFQPKYRQ